MQEITHRVVVPELAFTGDTTAEFITDPANEEVFKARLLIMECSFLDDAMSPEGAKVHCVFSNVSIHVTSIALAKENRILFRFTIKCMS